MKSQQAFKTIGKKTYVGGLLKEIRSISNEVEESKNIFDSIDEIQRRFFLYRQSEEDDNIIHVKKFKNLIEVMEHVGIDMFKDKCCTKHVGNDEIMSDDEIKNEIRNRRIAVCFFEKIKPEDLWKIVEPTQRSIPNGPS